MLEVASPTRVQPPRLEANGTSGRRESPARGPQWPGHRTFLSIYNEDHGRLFNGAAETSGCLSDAQGGGIAWLWMVVWCNCFIYMGISLQGITFTGLARRRGLSGLETGIIHACSRASIILGILLAHVLLSVIYPAYLLILGMVLHAAAIAALGALHWLPDDENLFLGVSAAIKCVAGIGFAIYFATMYTTLFYKNQQSYLATLILSEVTVGVGGVIGPIVGFELTQVWLYPLPYFAIGGCMLLGILIAVALPLDACVPREKFSEAKNDCSSLSFLGDVRFWVDIVTAALAGATIAHFETTLELHLSVITESEYHINYSYAIIYGGYAIGAVLFGFTSSLPLSVIYPAYLLILGMVLHAAAIAALGALHWLPDDENLFLGVSAAIKCVAGIGFAIYFATMYTTLFYKNQQSYLATLILSEVTVGVGGVIGPIVGFELTQVWLYPLPYFAIGGCMLLGILIAVALPLDACVPREKFSEAKNDCSSLSFLGDVRFWVDIVTAALAGATIAHFETTLELHLSVITESEYHINYSYAIIYGGYAIGAVLFGFTSSLPKAEAFVVFVAQLISAVAFLFVGPAHFLPIPTNLWLTRLGIGLAGLAVAGQFLPVIARVVRSATWPDRSYDLRIISLAVCAVLVMVHCGGLVLSLVSGYVTDNQGSKATSTVMLTIQASWTLVRFLVWITEMTLGRDTFLS
ncbi:MFS-type transporter SLC18B1 [Ixodes scapularis]